MQCNRLLLAVLVSVATPITGSALATPSSNFVTLKPDQCQRLNEAIELPADWTPYRDFVRSCPIAKPARTSSPALRLLAVFVDDYYAKKPSGSPWEQFPLPMLVDINGRCLARVAHLFPVDPPRDLIVRFGKWRSDGLPSEIKFQVKNPAVDGNYNLPTLYWISDKGIYQPANSASLKDKEKTLCP
jgi:hypothetical protein